MFLCPGKFFLCFHCWIRPHPSIAIGYGFERLDSETPFVWWGLAHNVGVFVAGCIQWLPGVDNHTMAWLMMRLRDQAGLMTHETRVDLLTGCDDSCDG